MAVFLTKVPAELRQILLDFTLSCLLEKPDDYIEHGVKYFLELRECRDNKRRRSLEEDEVKHAELSSEEVNFKELPSRKAIISDERYNPADDSESIVSIVIPKTDEEMKRLEDHIKDVLIFRSLDREELTSLMNAMNSQLVTKDEIIIEQGDEDASNFYVIESGYYETWVTDETGVSNLVNVYKDRGSFGELALMYNVPRAATIKAISSGKLWVLDRKTFKKIVLGSAYRKRQRYQKLIEKVEFLKVLDSYTKLDLADSLIPKYYEDGEIIFKQGDVPDGMYFIESGGITCIIDHPLQGEVTVTELSEGDYLGELALIAQVRRALTAKAIGNTKLAFLDKDAFERLLGPCHEYLEKHFSDYGTTLTEALGSISTLIYSMEPKNP